jgi:uncharacterized protein YndB with AHSA1/START domain
MPIITAERTIRAPIGEVFDILTDHANYKDFPGIRDSELVREGDTDRDGVGALRPVFFGPIRFEEEITAYERPARMDYLIVGINVPFEHRGGSMRFEDTGDGTRVVWTSTFRMPLPVVGGLAGAVAAPAARSGFARVLRHVAGRLES